MEESTIKKELILELYKSELSRLFNDGQISFATFTNTLNSIRKELGLEHYR